MATKYDASVDYQCGLRYDFYKPRLPHGTDMGEFSPSMCRQEFADECDINVIMSKYERTGVLPLNMNGAEPRYLDLTEMPPDFQTALNLLSDAEAAFMRLPAAVRKEFDNSPHAFVEFASDPENVDQMREWGLAPPAPPAPVEPAPIAPASPAAPGGPPSFPAPKAP